MKKPTLKQEKVFSQNWPFFVEKYPQFTFFTFPNKNQSKPQQALSWDPQAFSSKDLLFIYGLRLLPEILSWLEEGKNRKIVFWEENPSSLYDFLSFPFAKKIFSHERIEIVCCFSTKEKQPAIEVLSEKYAPAHFAFVGSSKKAQDFQKKLKKLLFLQKAFHVDRMHSSVLFSHFTKNISQFQKASYLNEWKDAFVNIPAIVGGAGPSLEILQPILQECYDKALLLPGGAAIAAFSRKNIPYHMGVAIDPNPEEANLLQENLFWEAPLIYTLRTFPEAVEVMDSCLLYAKTDSVSFLEQAWQKKNKLTGTTIGKRLSIEALSVTCLGVSIAHFLGCNPIILAGVDLSFSKNPYAAGLSCKAPKGEFSFAKESFVKEGKGNVFTNLLWELEEEALSSFAKKHPKTTFLDASPQGLRFSQIPHLSLKKIQKKYLQKTFDIEALVHTLCVKTKRKKSPDTFLEGIKKSLFRMEDLVGLIRKNCSKTKGLYGKGIVAEMDLKEEFAYKILFYDTIYHVEKALLQKGKNLSTEKWNVFEEKLKEYLQLF